MDIETPSKPAPNAAPVCQSYPPPDESLLEPASGLSAGFIIFAVLLIGAAAVAGSLKSGKLNLNKFFNVPPTAVAQGVRSAIAIPVAIPVAALKQDTFVVSSISLGQTGFAIINGQSRVEGDPVDAPGVTGWKVKRIGDGMVWLQNGSTLTSIPLSTPGIKPLDDQLHPLN